VSNFAENLRKAIFNKRFKAVDVSRGANIRPSVISRYLSGINQPSTGNLFAIAEYLGVSPNTLLNSSEAPESIQKSQVISSATEPLLKIIEVQEELIKNLQKQIKEWEDMAITISEKNRQKTKNPTKPNKQKVGFMKKHKKPKK
jgi:transcriptional regulator with XRE-family HTH domain